MVKRIRQVIAGMFAVAVVMGVTACGASQVGAAAVVEGKRLTVADLQDQVTKIQGQSGVEIDALGGVSQLQRLIIERYIRHEVMVKLADVAEVNVSEAEIDTRIDEVYTSQGPDSDLDRLLAEGGLTHESFRDVVETELLEQKLDSALTADPAKEEEVTSSMMDLEIEVNPRFGVVNDELGITAISGSVSKPLDTESTLVSEPNL